MSELSFEQMLDETFKTIRNGEVVEGTVIDVKEDQIILNIDYKADGIITRSEYSNDQNLDLRTVVHPGDTMEAKVLKLNDGDGQVLLSSKRLAADKGNKRLEEAFENKEVLKAKVTQVLEGGLSVVIDEARVFIPASLVSDTYERDLTKYQDQEIEFVITEFNPRRRRVIGDRKQLLVAKKEEMKKELFERIHPGDVVEGTIKNVTDFGAFIDLGGADGLLHISEMSWGRVELGPDVHGDLGQIQVGAHARCGGNAGGLQNVQDDGSGQLPGGHLVGIQVIGDVHEHLVDGVGKDIFRGHILQVDAVDLRAPVDVVSHPGWGHDIVQSQGRIVLHFWIIPGGAGQFPSRRFLLPQGINLFDSLYHLEQPGSARNSIGLQRRRYRQTYRLLRAPLVRYHQICGHGVQPTLHTLHRSVKTFEITADVASFFHAPVTPFLRSISWWLSNYLAYPSTASSSVGWASGKFFSTCW